MSYKNVGFMPDIDYPRSIFPMPKTHKTSFLHGFLVPIHCFMVQPGDSFKLNLSNILRMSTPLVPFMDGIIANVRAFAVPLRLVMKNWEKYVGANEGAGYQTVIPVFPAQEGVNLSGFSSWAQYANESLSYALGKNLHAINSSLNNTTTYKAPFSVLKERGYYLIWNKLFRAEQLQSEYSIDTGDGTVSSGHRVANVLTTDTTDVLRCGHKLLKVNKMHDYFVDNTISPQYGASVQLPLGNIAPLKVDSSMNALGGAMKFGIGSGMSSGNYALGVKVASSGSTGGNVGLISGANAPSNDVTTTNLVADLTNATAATVNELRYAFAVQRFSERANYGGNNYYEIIAVHFGVTNPQARMQLPEYLGGYEYNININQVTNQSGFASGTTTVLGEVGAVSVTARKQDFVFRRAFTEFSLVYIMIYTKHFRSYGQGMPREDLLVTNKFDLLWPEFMNIGDQKTLISEIFAGATNPLGGFGYQEAWAQYKFFHDTVGGLLNPSLPSGSLGQWSLADYYANEPNLSSSWIQEDRNAIARVLKTGSAGPDFIADFAFKYQASRIINIKKLPGLIDHVGLF